MTDEMPETVFVTALADEFGPRKAYSHCGSWPSARTEYLRSDVAHARIEAQAALIAELTRELRHAIETYEGEYAYPAPDGWTVALARAEEAQK